MRHICNVCSYETSRIWSYNDHISRPNACKKRLMKSSLNSDVKNVDDFVQNVDATLNNTDANGQNVDVVNKCTRCSKVLSSKKSLNSHMNICKGVSSLQCPTCRKSFSSSSGKAHHIKNVKCELIVIVDEKHKELEEEIKRLKEQIEEEKAKPKNLTINNFNANISYNAYTNLSTDHITWQETAAMYNRNEGDLPKTFFDVGTQIQQVPENRCIVLLDGLKSTHCMLKEGNKELKYPLHMILSKLIKGTATKIESDLKIAEIKDIIIENTNDDYKLGKDFDTLHQLSFMDSPDADMTKKDLDFLKKLIDKYSNSLKEAILCASESET
jgi:uncharacterized C2H2 Zn-finger protein